MINRVAILAIIIVLACQVSCYYEAEGPCNDNINLKCGNCTSIRVKTESSYSTTFDVKCTKCFNGVIDTRYETYYSGTKVDVSDRCGKLSTVGLVLAIALPIVCIIGIVGLIIWCFCKKKRHQGQTIRGPNQYQDQGLQPGPQQGFNFQQPPIQQAPPQMYTYNVPQGPQPQMYAPPQQQNQLQLPPGFITN